MDHMFLKSLRQELHDKNDAASVVTETCESKKVLKQIKHRFSYESLFHLFHKVDQIEINNYVKTNEN